MKLTSRFPIGLLVLTFLFLSGCRLYGGHGTIEATTTQIEVANEQFANELSRRQADLRRLQQASASNEVLVAIAASYEATVAKHAASIEEHAAMAEDLEANPSYLGLGPLKIGHYRKHHRALGAIVVKQTEIQDAYVAIMLDVQQVVSPDAAGRTIQDQSRYQTVPLYFEQVRTGNYSLTMEQALRADG